MDNGLLPNIYQKNDVFILPSIGEPWGLVVEEALNNGLPVIIRKMTDVDYYNQLRMNICKLDFCAVAQYQVGCYL
jgi:hypothetical protein